MTPIRLRRLVAPLLLLVLTPRAAWADDCSGLMDCWDQILMGLMVLAAIALFVAIGWEILAGGLFAEGAVAAVEVGEGALAAEGAEGVAVLEEEAALGDVGAEVETEGTATVESEVTTPSEATAKLAELQEKYGGVMKDMDLADANKACGPIARAMDSAIANPGEYELFPTVSDETMNASALEQEYDSAFVKTSFESIEQDLASAGPGARGIVGVNEMVLSNGQLVNVGHVFNAANDAGTVFFADGSQELITLSGQEIAQAGGYVRYAVWWMPTTL